MIHILANPGDYNASIVSDLLGYPIIHSRDEIPPNANKVINFGYANEIKDGKLLWTNKAITPIINTPSIIGVINNKEYISNQILSHTAGKAIPFVTIASALQHIKKGHKDGIVCYNSSYKAVAKVNTVEELKKLDHTNTTNYSLFIKGKMEYQVLFLGGCIKAIIPLIKRKNTISNPIRTEENGYLYKPGALKISKLMLSKANALLGSINNILNMEGGVFNILKSQDNTLYLVNIKSYGGVDKSLLPVLIKSFAKGVY